MSFDRRAGQSRGSRTHDFCLVRRVHLLFRRNVLERGIGVTEPLLAIVCREDDCNTLESGMVISVLSNQECDEILSIYRHRYSPCQVGI